MGVEGVGEVGVLCLLCREGGEEGGEGEVEGEGRETEGCYGGDGGVGDGDAGECCEEVSCAGGLSCVFQQQKKAMYSTILSATLLGRP